MRDVIFVYVLFLFTSCSMVEELKVLELFSGIGGMHFAFQKSNLVGNILAAVDINENANATYQHNFPQCNCLNKNIQKLRIKDFQEVNCVFMSPPCQPFSRNGNFKDIEDRRSDAFSSVCDIIKNQRLPKLSYILMENVMGFEKSQMRAIFIDSLTSAGFNFQEFIISPTQIGVANTRHRYYCIARKTDQFLFAFSELLAALPGVDSQKAEIPHISTYIDENTDNDYYLLPSDLLEKRFQVLDICTTDSTNSMCFTKSYSRYIEGTGSVYCPMTRCELNGKIAEIDRTEDNLQLKKDLKLRFFSSSEISRLMSFPPVFTFPDTVNDKQRYKLLGNSINVAVVSELIKLLVQR